MKHTVDTFFAQEIEETHKNIDRLESHLSDDESDTTRYSGQRTLLAIQREHLSLIEGLQEQVKTFDELTRQVQNNIIDNEVLHSKVRYQENPIHSQHSAEWWRTLHLIQFWTDFLSRIRAFRG
ncbi:MAG: hypothetical protein Phog2KO_11920 [Phototrophicaceae bacterium]